MNAADSGVLSLSALVIIVRIYVAVITIFILRPKNIRHLSIQA